MLSKGNPHQGDQAGFVRKEPGWLWPGRFFPSFLWDPRGPDTLGTRKAAKISTEAFFDRLLRREISLGIGNLRPSFGKRNYVT